MTTNNTSTAGMLLPDAFFSNQRLLRSFNSVSEESIEEAERRFKEKKRCSFGINFLDKGLNGIWEDDLIVLGAKSGMGKTQVAVMIALHNAMHGKTVHFFALEAARYEITRRIKYNMVAAEFFKQCLHAQGEKRLDYSRWMMGEYTSSAMLKLELQVNERLQDEIFKNLMIYNREQEFTEETFLKKATEIESKTDLIIIDHLHYFDLRTEKENQEIGRILKTISEFPSRKSKPVVLVSHLRKIDKRYETPFPSLEDFHGSSDIGKIATKAFMIKGASTLLKGSDGSFYRQTGLGILKNRNAGDRTNYIGLCDYSITKQRYEENFLLHTVKGDQLEPVAKSEYPDWAQ